MSVKCFMLNHTDRAWLSLRRYANGHDGAEGTKCVGPLGYHNAHGPVEVVSGFVIKEDHWHHPSEYYKAELPAPDDPRWPTKCEHCDYIFQSKDNSMWFTDHIYVADDGREFSLRNAPPGAMWNCWWYPEQWRGPDGLSLMVVCPNGRQWLIDGQASNCTDKKDIGPFATSHRCWVRHGTPPLITVDKNGRTCGAGAGSIQAGDYHGFLRNGEFT